jgi:hypothetical protein
MRAFSLSDISAKARASGPTCDVMDQWHLLGAFGLSAAGPREALTSAHWLEVLHLLVRTS